MAMTFAGLAAVFSVVGLIELLRRHVPGLRLHWSWWFVLGLVVFAVWLRVYNWIFSLPPLIKP